MIGLTERADIIFVGPLATPALQVQFNGVYPTGANFTMRPAGILDNADRVDHALHSQLRHFAIRHMSVRADGPVPVGVIDTVLHGTPPSSQEHEMGKGQKSNRETKKPKKVKPKTLATAGMAATGPQKTSSGTGAKPKR